jgi:hypothetical protein
MKRVFGYILIQGGFLLVFLAPFLVFYAVPRVERTPLDIDEMLQAEGEGRYFNTNPEILSLVGPTVLHNTRVFRGDVEASSDTVVVVDVMSVTRDTQLDNAVVTADRKRVVMDRKTGLAVHCCGETPRQEGLILKFPFGTQKESYPFWDDTAGGAYPMEFQEEEELEGLLVYRFESDVPDVTIDQITVSGTFAGRPEVDTVDADVMYRALTTVWVEPVTGAIIRGHRELRRWLADAEGTEFALLQDVAIGDTPEQTKETAGFVRGELAKLKLVKTYLPLFGPILGALMVAGGLLSVRTRGKEEAQPLPDAETRAAAST